MYLYIFNFNNYNKPIKEIPLQWDGRWRKILDFSDERWDGLSSILLDFTDQVSNIIIWSQRDAIYQSKEIM